MRVCGPERGIEGRFQLEMSDGVDEASALRVGGPPRIPPSMKRTESGVCSENRVAMSRADCGETALRSR